jgi:hypothetical protein
MEATLTSDQSCRNPAVVPDGKSNSQSLDVFTMNKNSGAVQHFRKFVCTAQWWGSLGLWECTFRNEKFSSSKLTQYQNSTRVTLVGD